MYHILEYNFSYTVCVGRMCLRRNSTSLKMTFQGVVHICALPQITSLFELWVSTCQKIRESQEFDSTKLDFSFHFFKFPDLSSDVYNGWQGSIVFVFPCLQRCFSHRHAHIHTNALKHRQQEDTVR